ncbi:hypothetical protein RHGRI_003372 [Rhododendron griersonianum]|uniref:Ribosomal protein S14 n=1 Tax=Rhododendron griersonianum TaxID=479676 RepID=A0AAV6L638_9ERIC|nr:hypothetical protein RHGRI_027975 [Rhododendron griersonianum]KAG5537435.1 hypothetical protein RHGRI_024756 [Rhododendron griersonianum]KAG5543320.1 hypothetical protein RHGRI_016149 [Rhododendron griersonianum]KAG5560059.1 hypothetical protein RHGRI_003372 [Rhododendron griersonianum]
MEITLRRTLQEKQSEPRGSPRRIIDTKPKLSMVQTFRGRHLERVSLRSGLARPRPREVCRGYDGTRGTIFNSHLSRESLRRRACGRATRHSSL